MRVSVQVCHVNCWSFLPLYSPIFVHFDRYYWLLHSEIMWLCDKGADERPRCVPLLGLVSGKGVRQTPLYTDSAVFCYVYTDKTTAARPGLELDFALNVVRNKSVTQFDWTLCSALTDSDHRFYWSTRIVTTMLRLIRIVIEHSPTYNNYQKTVT